MVLPKRIGNQPLMDLQRRLIKTGGPSNKQARYPGLLLEESHSTQRMFGSILRQIAASPLPAGWGSEQAIKSKEA